MAGMNAKYANLALPTAWRGFELSRGARMSEFERRLRALEERVGDLNLERDTVHLAAELAALEPTVDDDARFALIVLVVITMAALAQGSTRFPVRSERAREPMGRMLAAILGSNEAECERVREAIEDLLQNNLAPRVIGRTRTDRLPLLFLDPFVTHERSRALEQRLVDSIVRLQSGEGSADPRRVKAAIDDVVKRPTTAGAARIVFSDEQLSAVGAAVSSRLALISGGPGTGKTSIVVAILRVLVRLGVAPGEIALSAPTGRAAFRMREAAAAALANIADPSREDAKLREAGLDAATVHRLLGYSPERGTFLHHRNNPLAARMVIVDEGSMLDLALMERLAGSLDRNARLVILGDADQLPSVSAGAAFRDLLPADRAHPLAASSVRLTRNYRTQSDNPAGATIVEVSRRINAGDASLGRPEEGAQAGLPAWRATVDDIEFSGVEILPDAKALEDFLDRWHAQHLAGDSVIRAAADREYLLAGGGFAEEDRPSLALLFEHRAATRVLCVTRIGATGSEAINPRMHWRTVQKVSGATRSQPFAAGEPVIVIRNDYERGLFNGDQGIIVNARDADGHRHLSVVFSRGGDVVQFRLDAMRDLIELGYATTIHKAQGSEFDAAAIILPEHDLPLLSRELLYTAISRCRRAAAIIGDPQRLATGIARKIERFSGLADELKARVIAEGPRQLKLF